MDWTFSFIGLPNPLLSNKHRKIIAPSSFQCCEPPNQRLLSKLINERPTVKNYKKLKICTKESGISRK